MTKEEQPVLLVKGVISELPPADCEACKELAEHIRQLVAKAGDPIGTLALTLVGAETQIDK